MCAVAYKLVGLIDGAPETSVYSSLDGPIESLSMLRRSLLFAELANLSYLSRTDAGMMVHRIGFPEIRYYDREGAQAYIFANEHDAVVTCRACGALVWTWSEFLEMIEAIVAPASSDLGPQGQSILTSCSGSSAGSTPTCR